MRIQQMACDKLIFHNELHHEVPKLHVQRVLAASPQTISEKDVGEIGDSGTVAEPGPPVIKPIHVNRVGEHCEA